MKVKRIVEPTCFHPKDLLFLSHLFSICLSNFQSFPSQSWRAHPKHHSVQEQNHSMPDHNLHRANLDKLLASPLATKVAIRELEIIFVTKTSKNFVKLFQILKN